MRVAQKLLVLVRVPTYPYKGMWYAIRITKTKNMPKAKLSKPREGRNPRARGARVVVAFDQVQCRFWIDLYAVARMVQSAHKRGRSLQTNVSA